MLEPSAVPSALSNEQQTSRDVMIRLGKKLKNPYSVVNMQKAYDNLVQNGTLKTSKKIKATHYYVRFLPKSFDELAILQNDTTLELFDYPIDYELVQGGTYYHDPSLALDQITWQYCAVEVDFEFPELEYEIIEELYLPKKDKSKAANKQVELDINYLIHEALAITDNLPEKKDELAAQSLLNYWNPSGRIRVWDDAATDIVTYEVFDHWEYVPCDNLYEAQEGVSVNIIEPGEECRVPVYRTVTDTVNGKWSPVVGCKVRAYSWFQIQSDLTDSEGNFFIDENFLGTVNYSIKWERNDFDIRSGDWGQAYYNGPQLDEQSWYLDIEGGMSWVYAHIHRGAYTYYYANTWGIKSPPINDGSGFLNQRIHIGAMDEAGRAHYYDFNAFFTTPQIKIYRYNSDGITRTSEDLFGTTVHEFAHASHWEIGYTTGQYIVDAIFSAPYLPESWATGVEATITSEVYNKDHKQWQGMELSDPLINQGYTPIVWDMGDYLNQNTINSSRPIDNVFGFTLPELEAALYGVDAWLAWRDKIKLTYPSKSSVGYIDELFANYN